MRRLVFLFLALSILASAKDAWSSGPIKVLDTNEWCGRPGIPDWPEICGPTRSDAMALFSGTSGAPAGSPYSQILQIDGPDATYVVRRTSLDGGLHFEPGAKAQYQVDGKHLLIKFDRQSVNRQGETKIQHDHAKTDILQVKKR